MNNASELKQKAIEMTTQLLERKGYRIIDRLSGECISLVAADDGDIVFARVIARDAKEKGFPAWTMDRRMAENDAIAWLKQQGESRLPSWSSTAGRPWSGITSMPWERPSLPCGPLGAARFGGPFSCSAPSRSHH